MKQFGGKVTSDLKQLYSRSPQWDGERFLNLEETKMEVNFQTLPKLLYDQFFKTQNREPKKPLSIQSFDEAAFLAPSEGAKLIWYGHSAMLLRVQNLTILIDPMLGPDASPIGPFSTKRFSNNTLELIDSFPPIDLLLLTHDHYDHLDLASLEKLKSKVSHYMVALGIARHLTYWGIAQESITEFDWWDEQSIRDMKVTFTPTRHFSGRGLTDRAKSLWGGWVIQTPNENLYFSGDGGYGKHFQEIGKQLGPFNFGIMECGQYHENWHAIHMYPEESIQAALDAKVDKVMPVHWAGFSLAQHPWREPVQRFTAEAIARKLPYMTPRLGQQFSSKLDLQEVWWEL